MENLTYSIEVNDQSYSLRCSDGEAHVREIESRLQEIIGSLAQGGVNPNLSQTAMKIAIMLADQTLREEAERKKQTALVEERLTPLVRQLDLLLGNQAVTHSEVAISGEAH
jgi:cell division protein ZapA (FtsZ GTPase activity inhibitor)